MNTSQCRREGYKMRPTSIFVGGLGDDMCREDLEREFSKYGKLNNVWVAQNPPGFAFIEYEDTEDANEAIKEMNGTVINGSRIRVEMSRNGGRGGRGGFRGGRDGRGRGFRGRRDGGFRGGRGGYGTSRRGGYDSYGGSGRYGSGEGGGRDRRGMNGSRYGSDDRYTSSPYNNSTTDDYKNPSYRSRSPIGSRNGSSW